MRSLGYVCIAVLAVILASCSCSGKPSGKTGMTVAELEAKLESLKTPYSGDCEDCGGTGKVLNDDGVQVACPGCKGTGKIEDTRGPAVEDFYEAVGRPFKTENRDLIWEWWYYKCSDGKVRIEAFEDEKQGDIQRVVTGKVEKIE